MRDITILAVDLAKNVFQLHGINQSGKQMLKQKSSRKDLINHIAKSPECTIAMEACGGANPEAQAAFIEKHKMKNFYL